MISVKKELVTGVYYLALAKYSGIIAQIVITSILARLIMPEEFGIIAIATIIIYFIRIVADLGMGPAIIQNKSLGIEDYRSLFSLFLIIGTVLATIFFLSSNTIALFYNNVELSIICKWMSLIVFFNTIGTIFDSLLMKEKKFKFVAYRTLIIQITTGILAIIAAFYGLGVYALVLQAVLSSILIFMVNYSQNRLKPSFKNIRKSFNKVKSFSVYQFLFNIINYFTRNLDKLVVGKFLGAAMLGYYEKSYRLMMLPLQNLTEVVNPVMLPIFSQKDVSLEKIKEGYLKVIKAMAYVSFPLSAFLYFDARELILIFFGDHWELSIVPFKILSLSVSIQVLNSTTGAIFQAINNTKGLMYCGIFGAFFIISGFFLSIILFGTLESVAIGFDISLFLAAAYSFGLLFRSMKMPIVGLLKTIIFPLFLFLTLFLSLSLLDIFFKLENILISFLIKVFIVILLTLFFAYLFGGYNLKDIVNSIIKRG